jgi:hypothetical protein
MQMCGQLYATAALPPEEESLANTEQETARYKRK